MLKRLVKVILVVLCAVVILVPNLYAQGNADPIVLRFAHARPTEHCQHKAALLFKEIVERETEGRYVIEIYPNDTLGSPPEYTEQIFAGTIDMGMCSGGDLQPFVSAYAAEMTPFLFKDYDHAHRAFDGAAGALLAKKAEELGVKVISAWEYGFRAITNNKHSIEKPEDAASIIMRVPPEFQLEGMYQSLGAKTTVVAFPELYMALGQGVVDGQCNPLSTIYYNKFYEVQKYLSLTYHVYSTHKLVMNLNKWNTLSPEDQEILTKASIEGSTLNRKLNHEEEVMYLTELEELGMVVNTPDQQPFIDKMGPVYEAIEKRTGTEFFEEFKQLVKEAL